MESTTVISILAVILVVFVFALVLPEGKINSIITGVWVVMVLSSIFGGCARLMVVEHEKIWRPYEHSNGIIKVNGAPGTTACVENIYDKAVSVRTVSYGNHRGVRTGEITAELFTLNPKEKRCETYGSAAYLSDPTTGILIGFSKL